MLSAIRRPATLGTVRAATVMLLLVGTVAHLGWALGFVLDTGLSPLRATTSELAADGQPYQGTFCALVAVAGAAFVLAGPPLLRVGPVNWQARCTIVILIIYGVILLLLAIFPLDCAMSVAVCLEPSGGHRLHEFLTTVTGLMYVLGAASLFTWWRGYWRVVAGVAFVVQLLALLTMVGQDFLGVGEYAGLANRVQLAMIAFVLFTGICYLLLVDRAVASREQAPEPASPAS